MLSDAVVLSSVVPAAATLLHTTASHEVLRMRLVADMTGHTRLVQLMVDIPEDAEAANVHRAACGAREKSYGETRNIEACFSTAESLCTREYGVRGGVTARRAARGMHLMGARRWYAEVSGVELTTAANTTRTRVCLLYFASI